MHVHAMVAALWLWWRGSWAGRLMLLMPVWVTLVLLRFDGEPPHPVGLHQVSNIAALIGCGVIAWLICGLPVYLRGLRPPKASPARHPRPAMALLYSTGSMARIARVAAVPERLRLSR